MAESAALAAPTPPVEGRTRLVFVVGDPIAQVKAPTLLNSRFARDGMDLVALPLHVAPADLPAALAGLRAMRNVVGFAVTVPHKEAVLPLLDDATPAARQVGAANLVRISAPGRRMTGDAADGVGFINGLRSQGHSVSGRSVLLVGAGGAAAQIAFAVAAAGAAHLVVSNRSPGKAEALARRVRQAHPAVEVGTRPWPPSPSGYDVVINGTALGLRPDDALPLDVSGLTAGQLVCEVVIIPRETPLLVAAEAAGCTVHHGLHMLQAQLQHWLDFWGLTPAD